MSSSIKAILSLPFEDDTAKLRSPACKLGAVFPEAGGIYPALSTCSGLLLRQELSGTWPRSRELSTAQTLGLSKLAEEGSDTVIH